MAKWYFILIVSFFALGCCSLLPTPTSNSGFTTVCSDKQCFIAAANDCNNTNITETEDYGVMYYQTTNDCEFTKTLLKLNDNEPQDMKNLLEGKNMSCAYEKDNFNPELVNNLILGTENCSGDLKVDLTKLIVFSYNSSNSTSGS